MQDAHSLEPYALQPSISSFISVYIYICIRIREEGSSPRAGANKTGEISVARDPRHLPAYAQDSETSVSRKCMIFSLTLTQLRKRLVY